MKSLIFCFVLFSLSVARADFILGSGFSNTTGGRTIPILYSGIDTDSWAITGSSVGVRNTIYYQSSYSLSYFKQWKVGQFIWGDLRGGFGVSSIYSERGYRESVNDPETSRSDFLIGPAIRFRWDVLPLLFLGFETVYGVCDFNFVALSFQHTTMLVFGFRF